MFLPADLPAKYSHADSDWARVQAAGYLAMEGVPKHAANARQQALACVAADNVLDEEAPGAGEEANDCGLLGTTAGDVHLYDYHICYHASYSVPVLLFRGRNRAGDNLHIDARYPSCIASTPGVAVMCICHAMSTRH